MFPDQTGIPRLLQKKVVICKLCIPNFEVFGGSRFTPAHRQLKFGKGAKRKPTEFQHVCYEKLKS